MAEIGAVERYVVRGLAADTASLCTDGVSEGLRTELGADPLAQTELVAALRAAQDTDDAPLVICECDWQLITSILDAPGIERAVFLIDLAAADAQRRAAVAELPWRQWPRVATVDLEYCPPRVVEDAPGAVWLVGGLGLVTVGVVGSDLRGALSVAEAMPGLRSAGMPRRIAAERLQAALDAQAAAAADLERARTVIADLQRSVSWQMTAPLRSAKQAIRARRG